MKEATYQAKLLLQVHDELIFEVPKSEVDSFSEFVEEIMENALQLDVPLKVDSVMVQLGMMQNKVRLMVCLNYQKRTCKRE